jgi:hypothetical protein
MAVSQVLRRVGVVGRRWERVSEGTTGQEKCKVRGGDVES